MPKIGDLFLFFLLLNIRVRLFFLLLILHQGSKSFTNLRLYCSFNCSKTPSCLMDEPNKVVILTNKKYFIINQP